MCFVAETDLGHDTHSVYGLRKHISLELTVVKQAVKVQIGLQFLTLTPERDHRQYGKRYQTNPSIHSPENLSTYCAKLPIYNAFPVSGAV